MPYDPGPRINLNDPRYERPGVEDRQTQLESLLDEVWHCEADWRLNDRIDLALHVPVKLRERHACHPTDAGTISGRETGFQPWPFFRCPCGLEWLRQPDSGWRLR